MTNKIIIFGTGGFIWITPILIFFVLSSALSKLPKTENTLQKYPRRDIVQVIANGGAATIISVINFYYPNNHLFIVYLAAIAAATADTWASEIGLLSPWNPIHITKLKTVVKGTSVGISLL